jgi:D-3-phosphoglycerate dehydrogenase
MNVLVCDPISPKGIALLQQRAEFKVTVLKQKTDEAALLPLVKDVHALVVRSETKVTRKVIEAAVSAWIMLMLMRPRSEGSWS